MATVSSSTSCRGRRREGVAIGAHQPFRVVHVEDVGDDPQTEFVRLSMTAAYCSGVTF
jgi:hypothetical protein